MPVGLYRKKRLRYHHPIMKTDYGLESPFPSEKAAFLSKSGRKTAVLARGKKETKNEEEAFLSVLCPGCSGSGDPLLFFILHRYQQSNRILCGRKLSADSFLFVGDLSFGRFIYMGCPVGGKKRRGQRRGQFFFVGSQQRIMRHTAFDGRVVRGMANGIAAFFAGSSSNSKAFPAGTGLLFIAGGSIVIHDVGRSAVASEPAHLPVFPQPALDLPLECFSAGHQVWSAANGFPDAAAPSGNFDDDGPMPVPFGGKPSDLQCYRQKKLPMGAVFWTCGDRAGIDLVCLPVGGGKFGAVRFIADAELLDGVGACFIHRPFLLFYYAGRSKNEAGSIAHQRPDCRQAFINKE